MTPEKLVLAKSRRQRLLEMIIVPLIWLPVGPISRATVGDRYSPILALAATWLLAVAAPVLARRWAVRHGGEWVTPAERARRLIAEEAAAPSWQTPLAMTAMMALSATALFLVIEPLDRFGSLGGGLDSWGAIALLSLVAGGSSVLARRKARRVVVDVETAPADRYWPELRAALPRLYLAYGIGAVAGLLVALLVPSTLRFGAFAIAYLSISILLMHLLFHGKAPLRIRAFAAGSLRTEMLAGVLLWGAPMGILFSASSILDNAWRPEITPIFIAAMIAFGAGSGAAFGAFIYLIRRLADSRRAG